jgi:hypothetical protein
MMTVMASRKDRRLTIAERWGSCRSAAPGVPFTVEFPVILGSYVVGSR